MIPIVVLSCVLCQVKVEEKPPAKRGRKRRMEEEEEEGEGDRDRKVEIKTEGGRGSHAEEDGEEDGEEDIVKDFEFSSDSELSD